MYSDNFSVLTGAGSSVQVGGIIFGPSSLDDDGWLGQLFIGDNNYKRLLTLFKESFKENYGVEDFITFLYKIQFVEKLGLSVKDESGAVEAGTIKAKVLVELRKLCKLPKAGLEDDLKYYKTFIKRIISRPINLRRANLFTTNYDLVFEKAMDQLGVIYVDGFIGGLQKFFHPEAFNFDYYYPAATTEGRVSRMERIIHYYKIHGSLNWVEADEASLHNIYGIEKKGVEFNGDEGNVLIYPTPMKENDTIGFPYSEMFRRFANTIQQPQSVLVTYGYSFGDAHINRIILEALTIPSFHLIVVSYSWSDSIKALYERFKSESSVSFIIGEHFANWPTFSTELLPDLPAMDLEEKYQAKRSAARDLVSPLTKHKFDD